MNNVYIAYLDEITQDDLVTAKKIEADDKLILLTGDEPYMPCSYFYFLRDLNVEPEFVTIENNILITGFMLGLQETSISYHPMKLTEILTTAHLRLQKERSR